MPPSSRHHRQRDSCGENSHISFKSDIGPAYCEDQNVESALCIDKENVGGKCVVWSFSTLIVVWSSIE